jgi:hypothetical protein
MILKSLRIIDKSDKKHKFQNQNKGHEKEFQLFLESITLGRKPIISFEETYLSSLATFKSN